MPNKIERCHLTNRELDILNILWNSLDPMTASDVVKSNSQLTINTTQSVLRKLLKKKLIEVADIVYSGTVLCRNYRPTLSAKEFAISQFTSEYTQLKKAISTNNIIVALLESEPNPDTKAEEIKELEQLLAEYKKHI